MSDYVDPEDLTVQRNGQGEILPQDAEAGELGKVRVLPMTYGAVQERFGDGQQFDFKAGDLAEIFDEHIVEPDLSTAAGGKVDAAYVEQMYPLAPRDLLMAILDASGVNADVEATGDGGASVEVQGN